jgi:hypothetical protein
MLDSGSMPQVAHRQSILPVWDWTQFSKMLSLMRSWLQVLIDIIHLPRVSGALSQDRQSTQDYVEHWDSGSPS